MSDHTRPGVSLPPDEANKNVLPFPQDQDRVGPPLATGGSGPHDPGMDVWRASIDLRLARVENSLDWVKVILGLLGVIVIGGFTFFGVRFDRLDAKIEAQTQRLDAKIDVIPQRLSEEFRAMRTEMAAQTSAIANSITAAHQMQPPAPQIIVVPTPPQQQQTEPPKP
jgi:hypothetical protein